MKKARKIIAASLIAVVAVCFTACGSGDSSESGTKTLTIAHQYGMAYAPFEVMKEQKLIEKYYDGVEVEWSTLNSGSAINEGFASGDIDVGGMGVAPAITGVTSGVPYKIASNMSAQPHRIMTNDDSIQTLSDITDEKIALVNIGSIQHVLLAMSSLLSGSVECHLTTSPYVYKEAAEEGIHEVEALESVWPDGNSFILMMASTDLYENDPELYQAVLSALEEAITWINENKEEAAEMLCEAEDVDAATMLEWLNDPACVYSTETKGVMDMANFMAENDFLENEGPSSMSDLAFDNVVGN